MKAEIVERDIPYAPEHGAYGLGNLYLPLAATPESPVVLTIHGGGWTAGDRYSWSGVAEYFWRDLGCAVFNIEHRLASQANPWPACGDDCAKAANWLFSEDFRKRAGFSPKAIWICGGSAGGHLALWTALALPPDKVAGAISISGIADPEADYPAHPGRYRGLFGRPDVTREMRDSMSVVKRIRPGGPRLLLTHAVGDEVVPVETERGFAAAYRAAGNEAEVFEYPSDLHPGLTGHCIWIPDSKPHRLLPELESRIAAFMGRKAAPRAPEPRPVQSWTFDNSTEGWYRQPFGAPTVTWRDGAIHFITTRVGNYNIRQRLLPFDAARYGRFKVRMRITPNPQTAPDGKARRMHLKWGTTENPIIGNDLSVDFESRVASAEVNADAEWHEYEIDLAQDPLWGGKVNELWFEGVDLANAVVDIDWMRFE